MASVIRLLLERGLQDPTPLDFEARIFRAERVHQQRVHQTETERAHAKAQDLFARTQVVVDALGIGPGAFVKAIGGDKEAAEIFYNRPALPPNDAVAFVARVERWLSQHGPVAAAALAGDRGDGLA
ncbi:hypothetical protein ACFQX4_27770 [Roseomonas sp. GCM10028921]